MCNVLWNRTAMSIEWPDRGEHRLAKTPVSYGIDLYCYMRRGLDMPRGRAPERPSHCRMSSMESSGKGATVNTLLLGSMILTFHGALRYGRLAFKVSDPSQLKEINNRASGLGIPFDQCL